MDYLTIEICILSYLTAASTAATVGDITNQTGEKSIFVNAHVTKVSPPLNDNGTVECNYNTNVSTITSNKDLQEKCCGSIMKYFKNHWTFASVNLSDLLRALSLWKCPQFEKQCSKRWFAFSEFNKLTYDRFCNSNEYFVKCSAQLSSVHGLEEYDVTTRKADTSGARDLSPTNLSRATTSKEADDPNTRIHHILRSKKLTQDQMKQPCIQAGLIDPQNRSSGRFFEIKEVQYPMCGIKWQGFMEDFFRSPRKVEEWIIAPDECKASIIAFMVVCALLSIAIFTTNAIAILVFVSNPKLRNSQGVYKLSLAVSDLLVGLIVTPTMIESMRRAYAPEYTLIETETNGYENDQDGIRLLIDSFTQGYHGFAGFFTALSLTVSVYTLTVASFDRFMVVFKPLRYDAFKAKEVARKLVAVVWLLSVLFAVSPFLESSRRLEYHFGSSILIIFRGSDGIILYSIAFFIPLLTLWSVNIATFIYSKKNAKVRPKIRKPDSTIESVNIEHQLFRTLSIMVGAFSVSMIPIFLVTFVHVLIGGITTFDLETLVPQRLSIISSLELVAVIILMTNSLWNFFIYNSRSKEFRSSCEKLFGRVQFKVKSRIFRDSAKEARKRRTSAALSYNITQMPSTNLSSMNSLNRIP